MDAMLSGNSRASSSFLSKVLRRVLWFWPRVVDAGVWVRERQDPSEFRALTNDSRYLVDEVAMRAKDKHAPVLDIGCNCGRHLAALADMGFVNLHGVDVNAIAIEKMTEWFPQLDGICNARTDFMQRYLLNAKDNAFDVVFTRGATVELIHPSFALVAELCRVAEQYVILMIQENEHGYSRFWNYEFLRNGFALTHMIRPVDQMMADKESDDGKYLTLLVYRPRPA